MMLTRLPNEIIYSGTPFFSTYVVTVMLLGAFVTALRAVWLSLMPSGGEPGAFGFWRCVWLAAGFATVGIVEGFALPHYLQGIVASEAHRSCGSAGAADVESALASWTARTHYWSRYAFRCGDGRVYTGMYPIIPT